MRASADNRVAMGLELHVCSSNGSASPYLFCQLRTSARPSCRSASSGASFTSLRYSASASLQWFVQDRSRAFQPCASRSAGCASIHRVTTCFASVKRLASASART